MAFFDTERIRAKAERFPATAPTTGFVENLGAQFDKMRLINQSASDVNALSDAWEIYIEELERQQPGLNLGNPAQLEIAPGVATAQTVEAAERSVLKRIEAAGITPKTPAELRQDAARIAGEARERADIAAETADELGSVGGVLGGIAGAVTDPPILGSMLFGAPLAAGILRTAAIESAIAGASEVAVQPFIALARSRLGMELSGQEAVENVMFATMGGAIFGGGLKALGRGAGLINEQLRPFVDDVTQAAVDLPATPELRDAAVFVQRAEELTEVTPFSREEFEAQKEFIASVDDAITSGREGRPNTIPPGQRVPVRSDTVRAPEPIEGATPEARASQVGSEIRRAFGEVIENESAILRPAANARLRAQRAEPGSLEELLEMVKKPSLRPKQPERLTSFLKRQGGIKDEGGDIRRGLGIRPKDRPGFINKEGQALDDAALAAQEAGFFPERDLAAGDRIDTADLLDAIDEDFRGEGVFSDFDAPELNTLREVEDLERALDLAGADLRQVTVEDLPRILTRPREALNDFNASSQTISEAEIEASRLQEPAPEIEADALESNVRGDVDGIEDEFLIDLEDGGPAVTARQMLDKFDQDQKDLEEFANCALGFSLAS